jgi:membrane-associated phospholipid phosphatase
VGVHNPIDIVGAVLIAVLAATGAGFVSKRLLPSTAQTAQARSDIVVTGN